MIIKKYFWGHLHNIGDYEEYFSTMSKEGLHLKKIGWFFLHFEEGYSKDINYRIDMAQGDEREKLKRRHMGNGWKFLGSRGNYLVFGGDMNSNLKELYSTPEEQRDSLLESQKTIGGNIIGSRIWNALALILILLLIYMRININGGFYLSMLKEFDIYTFIIPIFLSSLSSRGERRNLKKMEERLSSGEFLEHKGDYSLMKSKIIIFRAVYFAIILLVMGIGLTKVIKDERLNLVDIDNIDELPMIAIKDIEDSDFIRDSSSYNIRGKEYIDYRNLLEKRWNLFIPNEQILYETVTLSDNQGKEEDSTWLSVDYYESRLEFIAKGLEKDILERERNKFHTGLVKIEGYEDASVHGAREEDNIFLLIKQDKKVVFIRYINGNSSMDRIIGETLKKINRF